MEIFAIITFSLNLTKMKLEYSLIKAEHQSGVFLKYQQTEVPIKTTTWNVFSEEMNELVLIGKGDASYFIVFLIIKIHVGRY